MLWPKALTGWMNCINKGRVWGVPTGFKDLDDALAGMRNQIFLFLLLAQESVNFTFFEYCSKVWQLNIKGRLDFSLWKWAGRNWWTDCLWLRLILDAWKLKTGKLGEDDLQKLSNAMGACKPRFYWRYSGSFNSWDENKSKKTAGWAWSGSFGCWLFAARKKQATWK